MQDLPFVTVIIPCRNEKKIIEKCLDSVINQDYPKDKLEILVIDGMSDDGTREIIKKYIEQYTFIKMFDNPKKIVPTAMNIGIKNAKGDIIIRMDAHTEYPKDYISKIVHWLNKSGADNVGGILIIKPSTNTLIAEAIAIGSTSTFGVGNAYFRTGLSKPRYVDTVPFGAYKKEVFDKIGLFDEELIRNQDDELNLRLTRQGGKILLVPEIVSYYYTRDSLSKLWKMYFQYGYWKIRVIQKHKLPASWRHLVPAIFILTIFVTFILGFFNRVFFYILGIIIGIYLIVSMFFSLKISLKKGLKYFIVLPLVFGTLHFAYGFGFLKGIWDFVILKKHKKKTIEDVPLTR
ncbi:MAG: glycosyltransferase family 2 protein [Sulfurihydrogenibium sp.]|jgi:cellulose synthase/poly-beta-1,6-N-acetylglucosamine synthase-like glycosyltransferase|nr:glycosyltransferase family 2 protein [Sulfurihydrogenibium sp.]